MIEKVLAFPAEVLDRIGKFQGFNKNAYQYLHEILNSNTLVFLDRPQAEENPDFKQLIPYHILKCDDLIFVYQRSSKSNEARLVKRWALGVGGHINDSDGSPDYIGYHEGRMRELEEEVRINSGFTEGVIGVIYDDSEPVGQVHFGVVHVLELEKPEVEAIDIALGQPAFLPIEMIKNRIGVFENWSKLIIENVL